MEPRFIPPSSARSRPPRLPGEGINHMLRLPAALIGSITHSTLTNSPDPAQGKMRPLKRAREASNDARNLRPVYIDIRRRTGERSSGRRAHPTSITLSLLGGGSRRDHFAPASCAREPISHTTRAGLSFCAALILPKQRLCFFSLPSSSLKGELQKRCR